MVTVASDRSGLLIEAEVEVEAPVGLKASPGAVFRFLLHSHPR